MELVAFYDASGHEANEDPLLEMAAVVATSDDWPPFESQWAAALKAENVSEFHHTDFKGSQKAFKTWKGDEVRRQRFMDSLLKGFEQCIKSWQSVGIDKRTFELMNQYFVLDSTTGPYMLTALFAKVMVDRWRDRFFSNVPVRHVFAEGDAGQKPAGQLVQIGPNVDVRPKSNELGNRTHAFQLADLVAGELRTFRAGIAADDMRRIGRQPLQRIFRKAGDIHFVDTWSLSTLCLFHPNLYPPRPEALRKLFQKR